MRPMAARGSDVPQMVGVKLNVNERSRGSRSIQTRGMWGDLARGRAGGKGREGWKKKGGK